MLTQADAHLSLNCATFALMNRTYRRTYFLETRMAEPWLRGPIAGMPALVMPAAHALMQAAEDIPLAVAGLTNEQLWALPGGAAAVGFHLRHLAGSIDRLLTYARGEMLSDAQMTALDAEIEDDGRSAEELVREATAAIAAGDRRRCARRRRGSISRRAAWGAAGCPRTYSGCSCTLPSTRSDTWAGSSRLRRWSEHVRGSYSARIRPLTRSYRRRPPAWRLRRLCLVPRAKPRRELGRSARGYH